MNFLEENDDLLAIYKDLTAIHNEFLVIDELLTTNNLSSTNEILVIHIDHRLEIIIHQ